MAFTAHSVSAVVHVEGYVAAGRRAILPQTYTVPFLCNAVLHHRVVVTHGHVDIRVVVVAHLVPPRDHDASCEAETYFGTCRHRSRL